MYSFRHYDEGCVIMYIKISLNAAYVHVITSFDENENQTH